MEAVEQNAATMKQEERVDDDDGGDGDDDEDDKDEDDDDEDDDLTPTVSESNARLAPPGPPFLGPGPVQAVLVVASTHGFLGW